MTPVAEFAPSAPDEPVGEARLRLAAGDAAVVVVSNRLPYTMPRPGKGVAPRRNVGGLVNALEPVIAARGGTWVGWDGLPLASTPEVRAAMQRHRSTRLGPGASMCTVPLSEREVARYYNGLCNRALWPLFHDFPGRAAYSPEEWEAFVQVNRRFAEVALSRTRRGDRIWVHDYQLMLVPAFLRELGFRGRIDFFLHTPFPPLEIFRALPWRTEILRGLLGSDVVGFHVPRYRDNFVASARDLAGVDLGPCPDDANGIPLHHASRRSWAIAEPIGIDVADFQRLARSEEVLANARRIRAAYGGRAILFGAERLDYTKGMLERFTALERYLRDHPREAGRFVFVQVVVPSRHTVEAYRRMKRDIDREVGRINGEFSADGWQPIHYRYRGLDRADLVAHYLAADVAVVTPLRDGMNLVAAEFVASREDEDGVLVLSEFAGIADLMQGAMRVNPHDAQAFAAALASALRMTRAERRARMERMRPFVLSNPADAWAARCLAAGGGRGAAG